MLAKTKINVFVVDDSAVIRQVMNDIFSPDPEVELDSAADPIFAMRKMEKQWPDVIVLDVEMPRMDGITFLKKIMSERPTPVVMCSTLTASGTKTTMQALSAGAIDIITKPKAGAKAAFMEENKMIIDTVKSAARAKNLKKIQELHTPNPATREKHSADVVIAKATMPVTTKTEHIIAIGTSTGGTQALEVVLTNLPSNAPGIVVVQHMPAQFTAAFADRLNRVCAMEVLEGKNNQQVMPGKVLIAPGGMHMTVKRQGTDYYIEVMDGPLVNRHKPSVDVLFRSVAKSAGKNALGIIMTGMGDDGARGLKEMRDLGASTIGQDEATSIVYGMPNEAFKMGGVEKQVSLEKIAREIIEFH